MQKTIKLQRYLDYQYELTDKTKELNQKYNIDCDVATTGASLSVDQQKSYEKDYQKLLTEYQPQMNLMQQIGDEWAGTYTVRMLMSKEYLAVTEEVIQKLRSEAQIRGDVWNGVLPTSEVQRGLVFKACSKDGEALPDDIPAKLFEVLASVAIPLNTLDVAEGQQLYKLFR